MVVLLRLDVVRGTGHIHEAANRQNHKYERQLMRHKRIVHLRGSAWVVEQDERSLVKLAGGDGVVPDRAMRSSGEA